MEIFVGVASTRRNQIPELFKAEDNEVYFMRYEVDTEDGEIYSRQQVVTNVANLAEVVKMHGLEIKVFVVDAIEKDLEDMLNQLDIKLVYGKTGNAATAASELYSK